MDNSTHTVILPVSDYNELMKLQGMKGAELIKSGPVYDAIKMFCDNRPSSVPMDKLEIYVKVLS